MPTLDINRWLESPEYLEKIDTLFSDIVRKSELSQNESETASLFELQLYHFLRSELSIEFDISKEQRINHLTHTFKGLAGRKSGHRRLDAVINNLIIEYKHHSKLGNEADVTQAIHQVEDYLNAEKLIKGIEYDAILTDGLHISYFSFVENSVSHTPLRKFAAADVDKIIQAILHHHTKKFTPKNIVCDFSLSGQSDSLARQIALTLFKGLTEHITGKSQMLYSEWKSLIHLSIDDNGKSADIEKRRRDLSDIFRLHIDDTEVEYKALYALHTTYAVIVKLIACHVLGESAGGGALSDLPCDKMQQFFERMEEGLSYRNMRVRNLLEGDFFSWYADKEQWSEEFWNEARQLLSIIEEYSAFSLGVRYAPVDIF